MSTFISPELKDSPFLKAVLEDYVNNNQDRPDQRRLYTKICQILLWEDFKWIFLFSAEWTLDFRNTSHDGGTLESKLWHWDYVDCWFLKPDDQVPTWNNDEIQYLKSLWYINPEAIPKEWDGFWIHWYHGDHNKQYLERAISRSKSIRFFHWWIGSKKPPEIHYDDYDVWYAESSQGEPSITCDELVKLIKLWGYIIIRNSCYGNAAIDHPLRTTYSSQVKLLLESPPNGFHLLQKIKE